MSFEKVRELINEMEKLEKSSKIKFTMDDIVEAHLVIKFDKGDHGGEAHLVVTDTQLEVILKEHEAAVQDVMNEYKEEIAQELGITLPAAPEKKKRNRKKKTQDEIVTEAVDKLEKAAEKMSESEDTELPPMPDNNETIPCDMKEPDPDVEKPLLEEIKAAAEEAEIMEEVTASPVEEKEVETPVEEKEVETPVKEADVMEEVPVAPVEEKEVEAPVKEAKPKTMKKENKGLKGMLSGIVLAAESNILIMNGVDKDNMFAVAETIQSFYDVPTDASGNELPSPAILISPTESEIVKAVEQLPSNQILIMFDVKLTNISYIKETYGEKVVSVLAGGTVPSGADVMGYIKNIHDVGGDKFKYDHNLIMNDAELKNRKAAIENYAYGIAPLLGFDVEDSEPVAETAAPETNKLSAADIEV